MTKNKAVATIALCVLLIGLVGYRLYGWITTGQLYLTSKYNFAGRYVSFDSDPLGFVLGFGFNAFTVLCAVLLLVTALTGE